MNVSLFLRWIFPQAQVMSDSLKATPGVWKSFMPRGEARLPWK